MYCVDSYTLPHWKHEIFPPPFSLPCICLLQCDAYFQWHEWKKMSEVACWLWLCWYDHVIYRCWKCIYNLAYFQGCSVMSLMSVRHSNNRATSPHVGMRIRLDVFSLSSIRLPHQSSGSECNHEALQQKWKNLLWWLRGLLCQTASSHRYQTQNRCVLHRNDLTCSVSSHSCVHAFWYCTWFHSTCIPLLSSLKCCDILLGSVRKSVSPGVVKSVLLKSWAFSAVSVYSSCYRELQAERYHASGICHLPVWRCKSHPLCSSHSFR